MRTKLLAVALATGFLANCGGGGGGSSAPVVNPTPTPTPTTPTPTPTPTPAQTYSIEGSFSSRLPIQSDSDTYDPATTFIRNDDIASAQILDNGAFVNGALTRDPLDSPDTHLGAAGTDVDDYFRVSLLGGQIITLEIAQENPENPSADRVDPASGINLDLELLNLNGAQIAVSQSANQAVEEVVVPSTDEYIIRVTATSGTSNYALSIGGDELSVSSASTNIPVRQIAPGRAIKADSFVETKLDGLAASILEVDTDISAEIGREVRLDIDRFVGSIRRARQGASALSGPASKQDKREATLAAIRAINAKEGRDVLEPYVYPRKAQLTSPSIYDPVPNATQQWNLSRIDWQNARTVLSTLTPQKTPVIAVIDSGFLVDHPDLRDRIIDQRDFVPSDVDGDGFDAEAEEIVDPDADIDEAELCHDFHGSHVASIALGSANNTGMIGVYPEADLIALKVGYSMGEDCDLLQGHVEEAIRYAAQLPNISGAIAPVKADVINLSLGANSPNSAFRRAIDEAVAAGVIVVAAAGNEGGTAAGKMKFYPAAYDNAISVASTTVNNDQSYFSSEYAEVDIAAPGGDLTADANSDGVGDGVIGASAILESGDFENDLVFYQGTSMAAPHVAGAIAMMRAIDPTLTRAQFMSLLRGGQLTTDVEDTGFDFKTGYGLISMTRMLNAARGISNSVTTTIAANPKEIDLEFASSSADLYVTKTGEGALSVSSVTASSTPGWLSVSADSVESDGTGIYTVEADLTGLTEDVYDGEVRVTLSNSSTDYIPVRLIRTPSAPAPPAALFPAMYALLQKQDEDGETFENIEQFNVTGGSTAMAQWSDVEEGVGYRLLFGSDADGDGNICDEGELCGLYPSLETPNLTFELDSDLAGLDFSVAYNGRSGNYGVTSANAATSAKIKLQSTE